MFWIYEIISQVFSPVVLERGSSGLLVETAAEPYQTSRR